MDENGIFIDCHHTKMSSTKSIPNEYTYVSGRTFLHYRGKRGFHFFGAMAAENRWKLRRWKGKNRATAREAALDVDKHLLTNGFDPVNILKKRS